MNNSAPNLNLTKVQNSTGPQQHHHHHHQQLQQHHHQQQHHHNHNQQQPTSTTASLVTNLSNNINSSNLASNVTDTHISNNDSSSNVANAGSTGISGSSVVTSTTSSNHAPFVGNLRRISANHPPSQTTVAASTTPVTSNTNGSLSDPFASTDGGHRNHNVKLSKTNLYIKGLQPNTSDQDLYNMCSRFGQISSTKAILEKVTGCCRGMSFF